MAAAARARAEFAQWDAVLRRHQHDIALIDATDDSEISKDLARRAATLNIATVLRVSENAVWTMVVQGEVLRDQAPHTWAAFRDGLVDGYRAGMIADTVRDLRTTPARERLDANAVDYAMAHTPGQLRAWLRRMKARLEPAKTLQSAEAAIQARRVTISHQDDGTSWISALVSTPVAIAIGNRLRRAARALPKTDPETGERDRRTRDQKRADLLAHWLTCSEGTTTDIRAEIAISIDAAALAGFTDEPGTTLGGESEPVPAAWVRELAQSETTLFRRLVLDPRGHVLDTHRIGYRPPEELRRALAWRDGVCRVATCNAPVAETDLDHADPWHESHDTSGPNLRCLCRRHHNMKSHGHLPSEFLDEPFRHRERWHYPAA